MYVYVVSNNPLLHSLNMRLLRAVQQLLETDDHGLRLTQCDLWGKRGSEETSFSKYSNSDQRVHCDYPNHTLVVPPSWDRPEVVSIIVYFDDSAAVGGETRVVPRRDPEDPAYASSGADYRLLQTPGARADMLWVNDRTHAESYLEEVAPEVHRFRQEHLYPRECKVGFETGSILFYRHDIWHRYTSCKTFDAIDSSHSAPCVISAQRDPTAAWSHEKISKHCVPPCGVRLGQPLEQRASEENV